MASANVDLVRSIYAALERGDNRRTAEWAHREIELVNADGPEPGRWTGLAGMEEGFREFLSVWEDFRQQAEEYRDLDDERVLVLTRYRGRGKTSGVELGHMRTKSAAVFLVRNDKVVRIIQYFDRERALADLGLAPEAGVANAREVVEAAWSFFTGRPVASVDLDGDWFDEFLQLYAPDTELLIRVPDWVGTDAYQGHAGMREMFADWFGTFESITLEIDRIEVAENRVATVITQHGQTKTGPSVEWLYGVVNDVRDGRIVRIELHGSPDSALARLQDSD
jgi:ketosteroid isomerase-like protein